MTLLGYLVWSGGILTATPGVTASICQTLVVSNTNVCSVNAYTLLPSTVRVSTRPVATSASLYGLQNPPWQGPPWQSWPQAPQFWGSESRLAQEEVQSAVPLGHAQAPAEQVAPVLHDTAAGEEQVPWLQVPAAR